MISVCIATYNGEKYIQSQLKSILDQLSPVDEVVLSDDGSTDNTVPFVEKFKDSRIRIIYNKSEKGYARNFENAISNAKGDFIFLSDQDDVWLPGKVAETTKYLKDYHLVVSDALFVDENLNSLNYTFFGFRGGRTGFWRNLYQSQYLGACMAFRRDIFERLLPFPEKSDLCPHDLWISLIPEFFYKTMVIQKPLIKYRRHGNNVSTGGENSHNSSLKKVKFRLYCLINVLLRTFKTSERFN